MSGYRRFKAVCTECPRSQLSVPERWLMQGIFAVEPPTAGRPRCTDGPLPSASSSGKQAAASTSCPGPPRANPVGGIAGPLPQYPVHRLEAAVVRRQHTVGQVEGRKVAGAGRLLVRVEAAPAEAGQAAVGGRNGRPTGKGSRASRRLRPCWRAVSTWPRIRPVRVRKPSSILTCNRAQHRGRARLWPRRRPTRTPRPVPT